jgi:hypothetical protein
MTTIVDEFTNGMSADTARANMRAVVEAYGYDGSGNAGDVRAFANTLLVPAGRSIGAAELGGGLRDDWNLLNNPAAITQAMLDLIAGSQFFPVLPSTVFSDDAGTTPAVIGGPVGAVKDMNGDIVATATGTARPTFGVHPERGIVNRANFSGATAVNTGWTTAQSAEGVTLTYVGVGVAEDGEVYRDFDVVGEATGNQVFILLSRDQTRVPAAATQTWTASWSVQILSGNAGSNAQTGFRLDVRGESAPFVETEVTFGTVSKPTSMTPVSTPRTLTEAGTLFSRADFNFRVNTGDTVNCRIRVKGLQFENAGERSAWQRNAGPFNITETGQRPVYYLFDDNVDDVMNATIDSELTDATIAWASDAGYTIQTGQTIADGSYNVLRDNRLYGFAIAGTDLSAGQTSLLEKSLKWAGGIAL